MRYEWIRFSSWTVDTLFKKSVIMCNCTVNVVMHFVTFSRELHGPCLGKRSLSIPWHWHLSQRSHKAKVAQLVIWRHCLFLIMNCSAVKLGSHIHPIKQPIEISFTLCLWWRRQNFFVTHTNRQSHRNVTVIGDFERKCQQTVHRILQHNTRPYVRD